MSPDSPTLSMQIAPRRTDTSAELERCHRNLVGCGDRLREIGQILDGLVAELRAANDEPATASGLPVPNLVRGAPVPGDLQGHVLRRAA